MDGERERVVIRERDGWIDGWVGEQHREECGGGGGAGGRGVEWRRNVLVTVVFCTKKKHQKNTREPNSTRLLHKGLLYNDAVYFIGVQ